MLHSIFIASLLAAPALAYDQVLGFNNNVEYETRSLDEIYEAAKKGGSTVTLWHGGDEKNSRDQMKVDFEKRFPGLTLNVTVDLSKYHDARVDQQLAAGNVYVDSVILQTLHDYPRWAQEGALLNYAPLGFEEIEHAFKDDTAAWYGVYILSWSNAWNTKKLTGDEPVEYEDWLQPQFKDKLVLTYPNDDDAVLFAFYLILQQYGETWFDALLKQNPRWVRGSRTPNTLVTQSNSTYVGYFGASGGWGTRGDIKYSKPTKGKYVTWPQSAAILKDGPNPEGARLLHSWILSEEFQSSGVWSVRRDIPAPTGTPSIWNATNTNPAEFARFMADRGIVERMKLYFESKIGPAQGLSPLDDDI